MTEIVHVGDLFKDSDMASAMRARVDEVSKQYSVFIEVWLTKHCHDTVDKINVGFRETAAGQGKNLRDTEIMCNVCHAMLKLSLSLSKHGLTIHIWDSAKAVKENEGE